MRPSAPASLSMDGDAIERRILSKTGTRSLLFILVLLLAFFAIPGPRLAASSTLHVPANFLTIQAAVNAASPGDTIIVDGGTYVENVLVVKSLNITGISVATTTIDANKAGPGIMVANTSLVVVSGFTVKNTGFFSSGIVVSSSSNVTIFGNIVQASSQGNGTYILNSNSSTVKNNTLTRNEYGIAIQGGFGNLVQDNNATGNFIGEIGVFSSGNRIMRNVLRKGQDGLELVGSGNIISRNLIANNTATGISLTNSTGNLVIENRVSFNSGTNFLSGVRIENSTGNRFYHNNILNNTACCPTVDEQVRAIRDTDLTMNNWDNATGSSLKTDARIKFVDTDGNGVWDFNETVVFDTNNSGVFDSGDIVIASINGVIPATGTSLKSDARIKFVDTNNDNVWDPFEQVVYDMNNNSMFDPGEPALARVGGNYWSDYRGLDNGVHGFTGDGIGDTAIPHPCPSGGTPCSLAGPPGVDWYPLMSPWQPSGLNVTASATPLGGYGPLQVSFTGSVSGGVPPYSFTWNFGDGTTAQLPTASHVYQTRGSYVATLSVTDSLLAAGSGVVSVTVLAYVGALGLRVVNATLQPVQGANVTSLAQPVGQARLSEVTNNQGIAAWSNLVPGTYMVQVSSLGFETAVKNVTVVLGQTRNEQVVLSRSSVPGNSSNGLPILLIGGGIGGVGLFVLGLLVLRRSRRQKAAVLQGVGPPGRKGPR